MHVWLVFLALQGMAQTTPSCFNQQGLSVSVERLNRDDAFRPAVVPTLFGQDGSSNSSSNPFNSPLSAKVKERVKKDTRTGENGKGYIGHRSTPNTLVETRRTMGLMLT